MDVADLAAAARREGMIFQSLHAPGGPWARYLWYPCEETPAAMELFVSCLRDCAEQAVPIMVLHSFYGFDLHTPTPQGLENFEKIVEQARRLGVKIAFENLEGEEYLAALLAHFRDETAVGFCWDSGHESCYRLAGRGPAAEPVGISGDADVRTEAPWTAGPPRKRRLRPHESPGIRRPGVYALLPGSGAVSAGKGKQK